MVKSYLIDGKSISSNPQYRGTALGAISRFGESRSSYCTCSPVASLYKPYMNLEIVGTIRFFDDFVLVRCCRYQIQLLPVWQLWGESVNRINPKWPQLKLGQILKQQ